MFGFQLEELKSTFYLQTNNFFFILCIRIWKCALEFAKKYFSNFYPNTALVLLDIRLQKTKSLFHFHILIQKYHKTLHSTPQSNHTIKPNNQNSTQLKSVKWQKIKTYEVFIQLNWSNHTITWTPNIKTQLCTKPIKWFYLTNQFDSRVDGVKKRGGGRNKLANRTGGGTGD